MGLLANGLPRRIGDGTGRRPKRKIQESGQLEKLRRFSAGFGLPGIDAAPPQRYQQSKCRLQGIVGRKRDGEKKKLCKKA
jgi:hypothetical protein